MTTCSPHAEAILALPHAKHVKLRPTVHKLAASPKMTLDFAIDLLDTCARTIGVTGLDLQLQGMPTVPFEATKPAGGDSYGEAVNAHILRLIGGGKR